MDALLSTDFSNLAQPARLLSQETADVEVLRDLVSDPDNAGLHFALGDALLRDGRLADAEAALRRAADLDVTDWSARFALGTAQYQQDRAEEALASWRAALALDPPNFTVRKQIWMVEHPEKFYPTIDFGWQKEQLEREGFTRCARRAALQLGVIKALGRAVEAGPVTGRASRACGLPSERTGRARRTTDRGPGAARYSTSSAMRITT